MRRFTIALLIGSAAILVSSSFSSMAQQTGATPAPAEQSALAADNQDDEFYAGAMHPDVMSDKPRKCPKWGMTLVAHLSLIPAGFNGDLFSSQAQLEPARILTKTLDGVRFELTLNPPEPIGGRPANLKYHLTDEKTGEPVKDLQPYLGAWGHTLILSEDASDYIHSHPTEMIPDGVDRTKIFGGPDVSFDAFFPRPGRYRVWSQFQRQGKLITIVFTINVRRL